jgi:hypothetical protein
MDDDQKWLEAAAGLEQDIVYLESAMRAERSRAEIDLAEDIARLKLALSIYKRNAATRVRWPSPDDLFCISTLPCLEHISTNMRRN